MVIDRGMKGLYEVDGLSYEDFFSYQNRMEAGGGFKLNFSLPSFENASDMRSSKLDASEFFLANNSFHTSKFVSSQSYNNSPESVSAAYGNSISTSSSSHEADSADDSEIFSDIVLSYINKMLMEEDIDENMHFLYQEKAALRATEKPFYDILGQNYPPPSPDHSPFIQNHYLENPDERNNVGSEFFPDESRSITDLIAENFAPTLLNEQEDWPISGVAAESDVKRVQSVSAAEHRGRKKHQIDDLDLQEGRKIKLSAMSSNDIVRSEKLDSVLLCKQEEKKFLQNDPIKGSNNGGKGRGKGQQNKAVVDLRTLLIRCAEAVAADDRRNANELLKQIRQHSSPFGDPTQRVAYCFADGLEARMASTGSQVYRSLVIKQVMVSDILKAYQLFLTACPYKKISYTFSNQTIMDVSEKASRLHIIDFGIDFGFQWPCLIQRLSSRPGGPPKLRITGIDVPQPGFRPTERVEGTGKRLADYAITFNVPFEYNCIATKWETIRVEDLNIDTDEVVIVNCMYRFRSLADETVVADCPRNKVLSLIREINPDVFIHGVVNGSYSVPFFVTRFREALFHFSSLFDMLDTTLPREDAQRMLIERNLFGREALNVVACEGLERVERPETYKQWQVRNQRAGFTQLPLNPLIMKKITEMVSDKYHGEFLINKDRQWLLQGWKGRVIYAISLWTPYEKC